MAWSHIDVLQDSPRTGLGIPVKTKKPPLMNQNTARGTNFRLQTSRVVGFNLMSRTTLPSSVRPGLPSANTRPSGRLTSRASQGRIKRNPPPNDANSQVRPRRRTAGAGPDAISTGPARYYALDAHRALSSSSQVWQMTRWCGSLPTPPLAYRARANSGRPPRLNGPLQSAHRRSACTACTGPRGLAYPA